MSERILILSLLNLLLNYLNLLVKIQKSKLNALELRLKINKKLIEVINVIDDETNHKISERRFRLKPTFRNIGFWENHVIQMPIDVFKENFRVNRNTFNYLIEMLKDDMSPSDAYRGHGYLIPIDKKIAIALKVLGTNSEYKEIGIMFGVGKTSVHDCFKRFLKAANKILVPKLIKLPTTEEFKKIAMDFEQRWQYPMAIGSIDGCHFQVTVPRDQATDYFNYKSFRSCLSLAICDANYKVYYVKSGIPGKTNDAGAFNSTELFQRFENGTILPESSKEIDGVSIPYHLLGDSAFALKPWLIKPYIFRDSAPNDEKLFNKRHSRARRTIENVFGRVKGRWRRVSKRFEIRLEDAGLAIQVCFALHNLCEEKLDYPNSEWLEGINEKSKERIDQDQPQSTAKHIRNTLKNYFYSQSYQPWD